MWLLPTRGMLEKGRARLFGAFPALQVLEVWLLSPGKGQHTVGQVPQKPTGHSIPWVSGCQVCPENRGFSVCSRGAGAAAYLRSQQKLQAALIASF